MPGLLKKLLDDSLTLESENEIGLSDRCPESCTAPGMSSVLLLGVLSCSLTLLPLLLILSFFIDSIS